MLWGLYLQMDKVVFNCKGDCGYRNIPSHDFKACSFYGNPQLCPGVLPIQELMLHLTNEQLKCPSPKTDAGAQWVEWVQDAVLEFRDQ